MQVVAGSSPASRSIMDMNKTFRAIKSFYGLGGYTIPAGTYKIIQVGEIGYTIIEGIVHRHFVNIFRLKYLFEIGDLVWENENES